MTLIQQLIGAARGLALTLVEAKLPHEIPIAYPPGSPGEGAPAGRFLLQRTAEGAQYVWAGAPAAYKAQPAIAELVVDHKLTDLTSLSRYLTDHEAVAESEVFVSAPPSQPANLRMVLDAEQPELGGASVVVPRHPAWQAWAAPFGRAASAAPVDLTHEQLADLLMDNAEDLVEPALAALLSRFRSAVKIEQDVSLDSEGSSGLRIEFAGRSSVEGAPAKLPRTFAALFPAHTGAWPAGEEPKLRAEFRLRVLPPKKGAESPMPTFRLTWTNAAAYELAAARLLEARVMEVIEPPTRVYLGVADIQHVLLPNVAPKVTVKISNAAGGTGYDRSGTDYDK